MTAGGEDQHLAALLLLIWTHGPLAREDLARHLPTWPADVMAARLGRLVALQLISVCTQGAPTLYGPDLNCSDVAARQVYARLSGARACRHCGCTDEWGCPDGCWWVAEDVCSSCQGAPLTA